MFYMSKQNVNEGTLKKRITYLIFGCRLILLIGLFLNSANAQLTDEQFERILYTILPITILYFTFIIKYLVANNRYYHPGNSITKSYLILSYIPIILVHLIELSLIVFRLQLFDEIQSLYTWIVVLEGSLAIYAGLYLSYLFVLKPGNLK